jgi:hypothetical protein
VGNKRRKGFRMGGCNWASSGKWWWENLWSWV